MTVLPFPATRTTESHLKLPVAPRANNRIRFAPMAVVSRAMLPGEAMNWLESKLGKGMEIRRITIDGPGDPLTDTGPTLEMLDLLQNLHPEMELSLTTLGLGAAQHARALADRGVREVTLLVDAVKTETAAKLYAWIRPGRRTLPLTQSTALLVVEQSEAVETLVRHGIKVRIQTTVYAGINDDQVEEIARRMAGLGASSMNLVPFAPRGGVQEGPEPMDEARLQRIRENCARFLEVSILKEKEQPNPLSDNDDSMPAAFGPLLPRPSRERPNVAVVSGNGMEIDLHLGQANRILIYGPREDGLTCLLEARPVPTTEKGGSRWEALARTCLRDCFALLAAQAGEAPKKILAGLGIKVLTTKDNIEGTVDVLYGGGKKKRGLQPGEC
ncbi:NifB/NifX family molybdenum-iron cluster-binding protein [Desulfolithobacter sp.]